MSHLSVPPARFFGLASPPGLRRALGVVIATALLATGCSSGSGGSSGDQQGSQTLNIGASFKPNSLDPAEIDSAMRWYVDLAYDPLIYEAPDGSLEPRLATSWNYVGEGNREFELQLRPNVQFSDGSSLTAEVVKANIEYFREVGGPAAASLAMVESVDVIDPLTVRLTLSESNPMLPEILTAGHLAGRIISGEAIKKPETLAEQTFGAGPYMLDQANTVPSDHYTYLPNPNYWDRDSIDYDKVVIKVLPNPNTALAALKTGQVDVVQGNRDTAKPAEAAGLNVSHAPAIFWGLSLADRSGTLVPALGDVRVRQALNYAVDREKIAEALYGKYGAAAEQIVQPDGDGYNDKQFYPYNPDQAKQLLAEAGYADGFTMRAVTSPNGSVMGQAISAELKKVGVQLELSEVEVNSYLKERAGTKFPSYVIASGIGPVYIMGPRLFLPQAAAFNGFKSTDRQVVSLYKQAAAADQTARADLNRQIIARLTEQAWFLPVAYSSVLVFSRSTVAGVNSTAARPGSNPLEWHPA